MGAFGSKLLESLPRVADIVSFRFKRPEAYKFQPGQWFVITFPSSDPEEPWEHHFSHSDAPSEPWLEFTTRMRGSDFKNALGALPVGSSVQLEGPFGSFVLSPDIERVAFLAGGIGITCVRSILRWLCDTCGTNAVQADPPQTPPKEMVLFFANHDEQVIPFKEELDEIAGELPELRVVHVISRPGKGWTGRSGYLDEKVMAAEIPDPSGWRFFVSGPPSFDNAMADMLHAWGIDDARITTEAFTGY